MIPGRSSDAGPDVQPRLCRCGAMSSERADCRACEQTCCENCSEPLDFYERICHACLDRLATAIARDIEADSQEFDPETAETVRLLAMAGATIEETAAYLTVIERKAAN